jgi:hypothetical protein
VCHDAGVPARRHLLTVTLAAACLATLSAAAPSTTAPVDAITTGELERRLRFIASDALEGRDSLSPGFRAAAEYLVSELHALGLTPRGDDGSFLQRVTMRRTSIDAAATRVEVGGRAYTYGEDLLASGAGSASGPVVYVGHGWRMPEKQIDPFAGIDVKGAILLTLPGMPPNVTRRDLQNLTKGKDYWDPEENARALGAVGIIRVAGFEALSDWQRTRDREQSRGTLVVDRLVPEGTTVPVVTAGPRLLAALLRGEKESGARLHERAGSREAGTSFALQPAKRVTLTVTGRVTREDTFNVVASVDGTDPVAGAQFIALGAHLDHIGVRAPGESGGTADRSARASGEGGATTTTPAKEDRINNGADDDGSGVVALMEIAAAMIRAPRPKRSLLFVWHTGEENGGWGSKYLTTYPPVPLDRIIAQLNVDMIGRARKPGEQAGVNAGLTGPDEVYLVGASRAGPALAQTIERVNRGYLNLTLNLKYDDPADPERIYERSDHYQYAQKGIPVAFFFSGLHEDYHRPSDEVDRIDFVKLQKVARTVLAVAWELANGAQAGTR